MKYMIHMLILPDLNHHEQEVRIEPHLLVYYYSCGSYRYIFFVGVYPLDRISSMYAVGLLSASGYLLQTDVAF